MTCTMQHQTPAIPGSADSMPSLVAAASLADDVPAAAAARFLAVAGGSVRYVQNVGWHVYTGDRWVLDAGDHLVVQAAMAITTAHLDQFEAKNARSQLGMQFIRESLQFAAGHVLAQPDDFDGNPYILGLPGGQVLDLVTRQRRPMLPEDMVTRLAGVHPDATDPNSEFVLDQLVRGMFPDDEVREYVRACIAYTLTGSVHEERMFLLFDSEDGRPQGRRGKSTLLDTLRRALGDLSMQAPDSLLLYRKTDAIPTDVASLKGRRMAWANELPDAAALDEARLKQVVSTGAVAARFMRQDYFTFSPTHKLWVTTNTPPSVRDTGEGVWRRLTLIPVASGIHDRQVTDRDGDLVNLSQLPFDPSFQGALMTWAIPALHTSITELPSALNRLRDRQRDTQDVYGSFIAERLMIVDTAAKPADGAVTRNQVWLAFLDWSADDRERMALRNQRRLYAALRSRLPEGGESIYNGTRFFPYLRVRSNG